MKIPHLLKFEQKLKDKFFDSLRGDAMKGTELIYTSPDWRDGDGSAGGYIHIPWNKMVHIYWAYTRELKTKYIILGAIILGMGILLGKLF